MRYKQQKNVLWMLLLLLVGILAACGGQSGSTSSTTGSTATTPTKQTGTTVVSGATVTSATPGSNTGTSTSGPITINVPTPVVGGGSTSQQVVLPDRVLVIDSVKKNNGSNNLSSIVMSLTVKNTGNKDIDNKVDFYQLVGAEGDVFGLPASTTSPFFGPIASGSSKSGTLTFQIPAAAVSNLRLLYRSEVASETVFVALGI